MRNTKLFAAGIAVIGLAVSLTSCSDASPPDSSTPVTIKITEKDGALDPSGDLVKVAKGQDITLEVSSDADDEFHVHSEPAHEFEVKPADNQKFTFSIDRPGTYAVESHHLEVTIVKLQVK